MEAGSPTTVLITGTSSGIGRAAAQALAARGHTVFATMRQVESKNAAVAAELRDWAASEGLQLQVIDLDVTDSSSVERAVQQVFDSTGRIDVLVNNAGRGIFGLVEAFSDDQTHRLFETNVFGPMRVTQAVLPHMRRQQEGLLIYLSSTSAAIPYPFMAAYGASKAALEAMALAFNSEVYSLGIDTVIIQAGTYGTEFGKNVEVSAREDIWEAYGPIGQAGKAMIAGVPAYFASDMVSTPQSLGEQIADYVAMPAGQRPLKVGLGIGSDGFEALNETRLALQTKAIEMYGFSHLLSR